MKSRVLCFGLIALFLTAPLTASLCGACATEECARGGMTRGTEMDEPSSHESASDHQPATESPCHRAEANTAAEEAAVPEATAEDSEACHPESSLSAIMDCCLIADAPTPETSAVPAMVLAVDIALQSDSAFSAPLARSARIDDPRRRPPQLAPQPLYTLHSAFLI